MEYIGFLHKQVKVWPFLLHYAEIITVNILVIGLIHHKHAYFELNHVMFSGPDVNFVITYFNNIEELVM